ncbi:hypothetical protein AAFF_G00415380 [Aldrovandia affinis]|uniref:Uncharacterized protein n=1 Tax=Aldrovandia affinis TaxID=143900 RepID=A0AAD7SAW5_9TELE|nr:hypothetical protein AAFF_G00415380 [Aldrovandia affinis]
MKNAPDLPAVRRCPCYLTDPRLVLFRLNPPRPCGGAASDSQALGTGLRPPPPSDEEEAWIQIVKGRKHKRSLSNGQCR